MDSFAFSLHIQQALFVDDKENESGRLFYEENHNCSRVSSKVDRRLEMHSLPKAHNIHFH